MWHCHTAELTLRRTSQRTEVLPRGSPVSRDPFLRPHTTDRSVYQTAANEFPALVAALPGMTGSIATPWTVLDAGANAGFSTRHFATIAPQTRVLALEVERGNYAALRANTAHFSNVVALRAALWGRRGQSLSLIDGNRQPEKLGREWQFMVTSSRNGTQLESPKLYRVWSVTVASLLEDFCLPRFDLIKLDIEGGEASVFGSGAELSWLDSFRYMYWEAHEDMVTGSEKLMIDVLQKRGLTVVIPAVRDLIYFGCGRSVGADACLTTCLRWRHNYSAWLPPCFPSGAPLCGILPPGLLPPVDGIDRISRASGVQRSQLICRKLGKHHRS